MEIRIEFNKIEENILSGEQINQIRKLLNTYIPELLSISSIDQNINIVFIFPKEFEKAVLEYQRLNNLDEGYTNYDMGTAVGKTFYNDNDKAYYLFIDKKIAYLMFVTSENNEINEFINNSPIFTSIDDNDKNEYLKCLAVNTIHHEIIHIKDEMNCRQKYDELDEHFIAKKTFESTIKLLGLVTWKEYYACRESSSTYKMNIEYDLNQLAALIKKAKSDMREFILDYRIDGDIDKMHSEVKLRSLTLMNYISYFIGRLYSYKNDEIILEAVDLINDAFKNEHDFNLFKDLFNEFSLLYNNYGNWSEDDFNVLGLLIIKCWEWLGVYPSTLDDGSYYLSIP